MIQAKVAWTAWTATVLALHFAWEMTQGTWYAGMKELPFSRALYLCSRATAGDLVITAIAFAGAAVSAKSATWPLRERVARSTAVFLSIGLAITIGYEIFALQTGRWRYDERMPTILGVGLAPLLQWTILPLAEVGLFRAIWRRGSRLIRRDRGE